MIQALKTFAYLVYPIECKICQKPLPLSTETVCPECIDKLPLFNGCLCLVCGRPYPNPIGHEAQNRTCGECLKTNPRFSLARAGGPYKDALRKLVHEFKFGSDLFSGGILGDILFKTHTNHREFSSADVITFVPSHILRKFERGFEPTRFLAKHLGKSAETQVEKLLWKRRFTRPQTGLKLEDRIKNVKGAFAPTRKMRKNFKDAKVILIDDVWTTGTTARECVRALQKGGAKEVFVLTVARTVEKDDSVS